VGNYPYHLFLLLGLDIGGPGSRLGLDGIYGPIPPYPPNIHHHPSLFKNPHIHKFQTLLYFITIDKGGGLDLIHINR
jgi:hypothetical protein